MRKWKQNCPVIGRPSMKVPPKRKGNGFSGAALVAANGALNESPSEKEGKYRSRSSFTRARRPSMKVPPKRKGN